MTDFTTEELNDINAILTAEQTLNQVKVIYDVEQGVFTSSTLADANARILTLPDHVNLKAEMAQLSNDLITGNQLATAPAAFTADETAIMGDLKVHFAAFSGALELINSAQYAGFWSDGRLAALQSKAHLLGPEGQADITELTADLTAGGQILPDPPIIGIHHHHHGA